MKQYLLYLFLFFSVVAIAQQSRDNTLETLEYIAVSETDIFTNDQGVILQIDLTPIVLKNRTYALSRFSTRAGKLSTFFPEFRNHRAKRAYA